MTPEKKAYLEQMAELRKQAVASVLVQPNSSKDVLTEKQKARTKEVKDILENGGNPFENISLLNIGGGEKRVRVVREPSPEQIKALEAKWKSGVPDPPTVFLDGFEDWTPVKERPKFRESLNPDGTVDKTPIHYCTYCGVEVAETRATFGRSEPRVKVVSEVAMVGGEPTIIEKTKVTAEKQVACPDCSLSVKNPRFPPSEG